MTSDWNRELIKAGATMLVIAGTIYLATETAAALAFEGYNYATNYISDLGVPDVGMVQGRLVDSPLAGIMNVGFILQGTLLLIGITLITRGVRVPPRGSVTFAGFHALGIILVGSFHGGQQDIERGFGELHGIGAALAIIGGNVVVIVAGIASRRIGVSSWYPMLSIFIGTVGLISLMMLLIDAGSSTINILPDGVWERGSVYTITVWEICSGVALLGLLRQRNQNFQPLTRSVSESE